MDTEKVQVEHLAGTVADVMVSVTINQSAAGGASANSLYPHVARAAGIGTELQNEKISILIQPFYQEGTAPIPVPDGVPAWMLYAALAGLGVFVILLMVVLVDPQAVKAAERSWMECRRSRGRRRSRRLLPRGLISWI